MTRCLKCGIESKTLLCGVCRATTNVESLCREIIGYWPGRGENALWNEMTEKLFNPSNFRFAAFALAQALKPVRRDYVRVLCLAGNALSIIKSARPWLYEMAPGLLKEQALSEEEKNTVRALVLDALYKDYRYAEAEKAARDLAAVESLPGAAYLHLAEFYMITRRYDEAESFLLEAGKRYPEDDALQNRLGELQEKSDGYRENARKGKAQFMPNPKENRQEVRERYVVFLASIGIEAQVPKAANVPTPIPKDQYPQMIETREATFDSFVAFDLETTGTNPQHDSMIEIGAVRVQNGQVLETDVFQAFVKPYKSALPEEVQQLTGIRPEDVRSAREMWEVLPDFMRFVGDSVLVGYHCIAFDAEFLARAGRYSQIVIKNRFFDVMRYAKQMEEKIGTPDMQLDAVAGALNIPNPRSHRALSDAVTTARVYLALRKKEAGLEPKSMFDFLLDVDSW